MPDENAEIRLASVTRIFVGAALQLHVLSITLRQLRKHVYMQGLSGYGKTVLLTQIILQLILHGVGFTVLDGVGALASGVVKMLGALNMKLWLSGQGGGRGFKKLKEENRLRFLKRFIVIDFSDPDCGGYRWNPLEIQDGLTPSEVAGDMLRILERIFESDIESMRRLQTMLRSIFTVLAEHGGTTVHDLVDFICWDTASVNEYLGRLEERRRRGQLKGEPKRLDLVYLDTFFAQTSGKERRELASSTMHAINSLLSDRRVSTFLSSPKSNINFTKIVAGQMFCVVKLPAGGPDPRTAKVLGALVSNRLQLVAEARSVEDIKSGVAPMHVLVADEFQNFFGKHWAEAVARVRNKGLALVVSHQTPFQPPFNEDPSLLQAFKDNCSTHVFFRCSYMAAEKEAAAIYQPKGLLEKRRYVETSTSVGWSTSRSRSMSIARQVSEAITTSTGEGEQISLGQGLTLSIGANKGVVYARSQNWNIAQSEGWSHVESRSEGWSITRTKSKTLMNGKSVASGNAQSSSEGTSRGSSLGRASSHSDSAGTFLSFSNGGPDPASLALGLSGSMGRSSSSGDSHSSSYSEQQSRSSMLGSAISSLVSLTQSNAVTRGVAKGRSYGRSVSDGVSGSESVSRGEAISKALSNVETTSRALARSMTRAASHTRSKSVGRTEGETRSVSRSEQAGQSGSTSTTSKVEYYGVQEEAIVNAIEMASLKSREVIIRVNGDETVAIKGRTLDMNQQLMTTLGRRDFAAEALRICAPRKAPPPPLGSPLDRLRLEKLGELQRGED